MCCLVQAGRFVSSNLHMQACVTVQWISYVTQRVAVLPECMCCSCEALVSGPCLHLAPVSDVINCFLVSEKKCTLSFTHSGIHTFIPSFLFVPFRLICMLGRPSIHCLIHSLVCTLTHSCTSLFLLQKVTMQSRMHKLGRQQRVVASALVSHPLACIPWPYPPYSHDSCVKLAHSHWLIANMSQDAMCLC